MRLVFSMVSARVWLRSPSMRYSKPSSIPTTSTPSSRARMLAAPITALIPGAGPPPTRMPSLPRSSMRRPPSRGESRAIRRRVQPGPAARAPARRVAGGQRLLQPVDLRELPGQILHERLDPDRAAGDPLDHLLGRELAPVAVELVPEPGAQRCKVPARDP